MMVPRAALGLLVFAPVDGAFLGGAAVHGRAARASSLSMQAVSEGGLDAGQTFGPTNPAHPAKLPWTNLEKQEGVQILKAKSNGLRAPLDSCMKNDEIFVSKDSIHILKHHGSYMQTNREIKKKKERDLTYQFMLRLKVPVGEVPAHVFRELDDLSNKYGQGDLRATTRQVWSRCHARAQQRPPCCSSAHAASQQRLCALHQSLRGCAPPVRIARR